MYQDAAKHRSALECYWLYLGQFSTDKLRRGQTLSIKDASIVQLLDKQNGSVK